MSIGDAEIKTQERVIRFFKDPEILGYQYIGNLSDYQNKNIKEDRLRQYLRLKGYADKLVDAAVMQLQQEAGNLSRGVYDANKTVYSRLKYGIPVSESPEKPPVTVQLVDEEKPLNNDFAIAEEVTVVEQSEKRPDLVVYLNGIAVAVIELKRSSISVSEGIRQNLTNQKNSFIQSFFTTMQFCMAGNESEGLRYGTLLTGEKFYIKNMHLQVKPPDGHVVISAPLSVDDKAIEAYARTQLGFIKRAIAQFQDQPRASSLETYS